jgi:hypothetical protein
MHAYRGGQGPQRSRVLYVFRTPSNAKVGRHALDEEVMEALEHTHPDLTFDWSVLQREMGSERAEPRDWRDSRDSRERGGWRGPGSRAEPRPASAPETQPARVEDQSPLGRVLGAGAAARLRGLYNDLLQRITRRARTPEDRERLTERAVRLNPDDWADDGAIRAGAQSVEAEWAAIAGELPQRRRGRRGGRHRRDGMVAPPGGPGRPPENGEATPADETPPADPSGIMLGQGESDEAENTSGLAGADGDPDDLRDDGRSRTDDDAPAASGADAPTADDPTRFHEDG